MINIIPSQKITKIYLVTNCYNDPNKVYIGKTKTNYRIYGHKRKFGDQIIFTYIDQIESLDYKDWEPLEIFWIEYFRFLGFSVQNQNKGGGGPITHTQLTKDKISKINKGRKHSLEHINKRKKSLIGRVENQENKKKRIEKLIGRKQTSEEKIKRSLSISKPILQYDLEGNFIKEWHSITEASNILKINNNSISKACQKEYKTAGKYVWRLKNDPIVGIFNISPRKKYNHSYLNKKVIQYDLKENFIKEWNSIKEASSILNIHPPGITNCCKGNIKTSGGFIWKYKNK